MNNLTNKIALITGATSGIGEACAKRFAKAGAYVIVAGRNEQKGTEIVNYIRQNKGNASFLYLDITNDKSILMAQKTIEKQYGCLDILFNNAGVYPITPVLKELTREFTNTLFDTNISGTIMVTKQFLDMLKSSKGTILNNASIAGLTSFTPPSGGEAYAYSASKAGIIKFTQLLAKKYGSEVRSNCICPGVIKTPIFKFFDEKKYAASIPMGRVGTPEDVATTANFLVSDDAGYINGCIVTIDGGQSI